MYRDGAWAYGYIIEAVGLILNIQIDVIQLIREAVREELIMTEGRFTAAAIPNASHIILLLRVNKNHYHATGCQPIMPSASINVILPTPIFSKDEHDKLFPNSEDKEQWSKAIDFIFQYMSLSSSQRDESKLEFDGWQHYFRMVKDSMNQLKASGAIIDELFEKMNNCLNLVLENEPEMRPSPRSGRR